MQSGQNQGLTARCTIFLGVAALAIAATSALLRSLARLAACLPERPPPSPLSSWQVAAGRAKADALQFLDYQNMRGGKVGGWDLGGGAQTGVRPAAKAHSSCACEA